MRSAAAPISDVQRSRLYVLYNIVGYYNARHARFIGKGGLFDQQMPTATLLHSHLRGRKPQRFGVRTEAGSRWTPTATLGIDFSPDGVRLAGLETNERMEREGMNPAEVAACVAEMKDRCVMLPLMGGRVRAAAVEMDGGWSPPLLPAQHTTELALRSALVYLHRFQYDWRGWQDHLALLPVVEPSTSEVPEEQRAYSIAEETGTEGAGSEQTENDDFPLEKIIDWRIRRGAEEYLVLWASGEKTWEPASMLAEDGWELEMLAVKHKDVCLDVAWEEALTLPSVKLLLKGDAKNVVTVFPQRSREIFDEVRDVSVACGAVCLQRGVCVCSVRVLKHA